MPQTNIDAISVSIKACTDRIHIDYTGLSNHEVLRNFERMYERKIKVEASSVLIPQYIDCDEIERITKLIADIDPTIPYHMVGYVPVPNAPWRGAVPEEMEHAAHIASKYLSNVTFSCLTPKTRRDLRAVDSRFKSTVVA